MQLAAELKLAEWRTKDFTKERTNCDVTRNYSFIAIVRRRRGILRIFQVGDRRRPGDRRNGPAYFIDCLYDGRPAMTINLIARDVRNVSGVASPVPI